MEPVQSHSSRLCWALGKIWRELRLATYATKTFPLETLRMGNSPPPPPHCYVLSHRI